MFVSWSYIIFSQADATSSFIIQCHSVIYSYNHMVPLDPGSLPNRSCWVDMHQCEQPRRTASVFSLAQFWGKHWLGSDPGWGLSFLKSEHNAHAIKKSIFPKDHFPNFPAIHTSVVLFLSRSPVACRLHHKCRIMVIWVAQESKLQNLSVAYR
jgi:hypothetical protein